MKRVFNLIIIDERVCNLIIGSGRKSIINHQALVELDETLESIDELYPDMEQRVTLITFDSSQTKYASDNVPASKTHLLTSRDYCPNGATPLYDAIGAGIRRLNSKTKAEDNVLVTIITDGESLKMVKPLIEKLKKQNWTFTLFSTDNFEFQEDAEGTRRVIHHICHTRWRPRRAYKIYNFRIAPDAPMPKGATSNAKRTNKQN